MTIKEGTAKLALESGFVYNQNDDYYNLSLQRWLREVHKLYIELKPVLNYDSNLNRDIYSWYTRVFTIENRERVNVSGVLEVVGDNYEDALEWGLNKALRGLVRK